MSLGKLIGLSLLLTIAVSAWTATTAGAAEVQAKYFIEGIELKAPEAYNAIVSPVELNSEIAGINLMIECNASEKGTLERGGKQALKITFTKCTPYEVKKGEKHVLVACTAKQFLERYEEFIIWIVPIYQYLRIERWSETLANAPGETCLLAGKYELKGTNKSSLPEAETEKLVHELNSPAKGISSELELNGKPATLTYNSSMKLASGKKWSMRP
jgi:hypothetical protein